MASTHHRQGRTRFVLRRGILPLVAAAAVAAPITSAPAATFRWVGGMAPSPTLWSYSLNWVPFGAPTGLSFADLLEFDGGFGVSLNNVRDDFILNGIRALAGTTGTVTGRSLRLAGPSPFIDVGPGGTFTLTSALTGTNDWSKLGVGTLQLAGANPDYAGTVRVDAGTLALSGAGALAPGASVDVGTNGLLRVTTAQTFALLSGAGRVQLDASAAVGQNRADSTFSGQLAGSGGLTKAGSGRLTISGASAQYRGPVTVADGTLILPVASALSAVPGFEVQAGGTLRLGTDRKLDFLRGSGVVQLDGALTLGSDGGEFVFAGTFTGNGSLTADGGHITLTGNSQGYTGAVTVNRGILDLGASAGLGYGTALVVNGPARLIVGNPAASTGSLAGSGTIEVARQGFVFGTNGADTTFSGTVIGSQPFAKTGSGVFTFEGAANQASTGAGGGIFRVTTGTGNGTTLYTIGGRFELQGAQATWTVSDDVNIMRGQSDAGRFGFTVLSVTGGAVLTSARGTVEDGGFSAANLSSEPMVIVSGRSPVPGGPASTWTMSGALSVGPSLFGSVSVEAGGQLVTGDALLADAPAGRAWININGTDGNSRWTNRGGIEVGRQGSASLNVRSGGRLDTASLSFGTESLAPGAPNVVQGLGSMIATGRSPGGLGASTVAVSGALKLGGKGIGRLFVEEGASLTAGSALLGESGGGSGEMWVRGPTSSAADAGISVAAIAGPLEIGRGGRGVIHVFDGGRLFSGASVIGGTTGGEGFAELASPDGKPVSLWTAASLDVGTGGVGTLHVESGGRVETQALRIGQGTGNGRVVLDGGVLQAAGIDLETGGSFDWRRGLVRVDAVTLGANPWAPRLTMLTAGQQLQAGRIDVANGLLVLNGGKLAAQRVVLGGGTVLGFSGFEDSVLGTADGSFVVLEGAGTLASTLRVGNGAAQIRASGGVLTVGDANRANAFDFAGSVNVAGGSRLLIVSADRATLGRSTALDSGGVLQSVKGLLLPAGRTLEALGTAEVVGNFTNQGTVRGPTGSGQALEFNDPVDGAGAFTGNVRFHQTHSPGNSPAGQSFENVAYAPTATLVIEILGTIPGTQHDRVDASGLATLGGTLDVRFLGDYTPAAGTSFVVMTWGLHAGSFAALDVSGLDPALQLTAIYGEHALTLTTTPVPEPANWALLLAGIGAIGWRSRRRAKTASGTASVPGH